MASSFNAQHGGYDSLNRLRGYQRGVLSNGTGGANPAPAGGSIVSQISLLDTNVSAAYDLDGLGNWRRFLRHPVGGDEVVQTRQHNGLNQIASVQENDEPKTPFVYDRKGNLLNDGVHKYEYDAFGRRIQKTVSNGGLSGNIPNGKTDYIYNTSEQCVEERNPNGGEEQNEDTVIKQHVWGRYIDEPVQIKTYETINGNPPGAYYPLQDLLYRTTALADASGNIVEAQDSIN